MSLRLLRTFVAAFSTVLPLTAAALAQDAAESEELTSTVGDSSKTLANRPSLKKAVIDPALNLIDPRTYRLKVVLRIEAQDATATNVSAVGPIPLEWPEQRLRLLSETITPGARATEQILKGQAGIIKLTVASIPKGGHASIERLYEITRYRTQFNIPPEELKLAKYPPPELREQLTAAAPGMEIQHPTIVELAKSLKKEEGLPWDGVKHMWQWTRDNVKFQNGDFRGALFAVENKCGDCEEMSALFIGLCRLNGGVARTVWVEGHDYPEFYMLDKQGKGHWIPAQVVGPEWFGEMMEYRPIFQKGDRFFDPFQKQYVRYVPHTVRAEGAAAPLLKVEHQIIADSDINGPSYTNP